MLGGEYRKVSVIALLVVVNLSTLLALPAQTNPQTRDVVSATAPSPSSELKRGSYYALVIGIDHYEHGLPKLETPVNDAKEISELLRNQYGFKTQLLLDAEATREHIVEALEHYRGALSEDDSLLIYYGGHGFFDKGVEQSYWAPVDAGNDSYAGWISAKQITTSIKAISARHVLVISSSCFSGVLIHAASPMGSSPAGGKAYLDKMLQRASRNVMCSCGSDPPSDYAAEDSYSVFAGALLQGLKQFQLNEFTAEELFVQVKEWVGERSRQLPTYNPVRDSGHHEGDFVFFRADPPPPTQTNTQKRDIINATAPPPSSELKQGSYHALVIGINNYAQQPHLETPVSDANAVATVLKEQYGFQTQMLLDTDATHDQVIMALEGYSEGHSHSLPENDSLLIYFAGHGQYVEAKQQAYWAPIDAGMESYSHWISAREITDTARAIHARHVLIVSDSCYSGMLTKGATVTMGDLTPDERRQELEKLLRKRSRIILSSGGKEPVLDGGCPGHSVFACAFLKYLQELRPEFAADELFVKIRNLVLGRAEQNPEYNRIANSSDEGGEFVFFPKSSPHEGPPPPPPINTTLEVSPDKEQIYKTLKDYQEGYTDVYTKRDIHNLKSVWPSMTYQQEREIKQGAKMPGLRDVKVELRNIRISITGDTAKVKSDQYMIHKEFNLDKPPQNDRVTIVLRKSAGGWVIDRWE